MNETAQKSEPEPLPKTPKSVREAKEHFYHKVVEATTTEDEDAKKGPAGHMLSKEIMGIN